LGNEKSFVQRLYLVQQGLFQREDEVPDSVIAINVAYDKQFIDWFDEYSVPNGSLAITDRRKLLDFLQIAKEFDNYRFIMLDVAFTQDVHTEIDSLLFATIVEMDRIVIPCHDGFELSDSVLQLKSGYADYRTSLDEGDFVRYQFLSQNRPSIAWKMYTESTDAQYKRWGPFSFCNGRLSWNSLFLNFKVIPPAGAYTSNGEKSFYNLGADLLNQADQIDFETFLKSKVIIIGDLTENDIHNTYAGPLSGVYINYNAYIALMNGKHYVNWKSMLILFIIYTLITLFLLKHVSIFDCIPILNRIKSRTWRFIFSCCGFSIFLSFVSGVFYFVEGSIYDILAISIYFSCFSGLLDFYRTLKTK
jgi:hypothetical protein